LPFYFAIRPSRGPNSNGIVLESLLPEEWDSQRNIEWRASIPGEGWSAPVIVGDRVYVTTAVTESLLEWDYVNPSPENSTS
jgi:hypothetical protein